MTQDSYNMPGIVEVRHLKPEDVTPDVVSSFLAGVPAAVFADGTRVSLEGEPTCQAVEEHSNNGRIEKATLTFMTTEDVPRAGAVWMIRQANGEWWLIGRREPVYPTVKVTTNTGVPGGDRAVKTVTVEYQGFKALIPLEN